MQGGSNVSLGIGATKIDCSFCQQDNLAPYILTETSNFYLATDHAPLVEGHLLIISKSHFLCYGDAPSSLDSELLTLKNIVQRFFARYYAAPVFWEHGIFRQTVFHAHLHCFPFGSLRYSAEEKLHERIVYSQDELRDWYSTYGHYFYLEDSRYALIFPPRLDHYQRVIREVVYPSAAPYFSYRGWRSPQQRLEAGKPLIQSAIAKWNSFQKEEVQHAS